MHKVKSSILNWKQYVKSQNYMHTHKQNNFFAAFIFIIINNLL